MQPPTTLGGQFLGAVERDPNRIFVDLAAEGRRLSYREVFQVVARLVERFRELGIRPGDHLLCYMEEQYPTTLLLLACALARVKLAPVSPLFSEQYLLDGVVGPLQPRAVVTSPDRTRLLLERGLPVLSFEASPLVTQDIAVLVDGVLIDDGRAMARLREADKAIDGGDVLFVQATSGSTGRPKLVPRRHSALVRYARFVGPQLPAARVSAHRMLLVEPLTHAFACHIMSIALELGASLVIPTELSASVRLGEVRALDPTVLPILPRVQRALWRQYLAEGPPRGDRRLFGPAAEYAISAGGIPFFELLRFVADRQGLDIIEFYGSTEASIIACTPRRGWRPPYCGRTVPDAQLRIGSDGGLEVKSPGLTPGYVESDGHAAAFTADGFYRTGDQAELSADGYVRILGRIGEVFGSYEGAQIYPARIEQLVEAHPWARQAIVVGDGKPYLTAMIVVSEASAPGADGYLSSAHHGAIYERIGADIARMNARLERIERIVRIALFATPFPDDVYVAVGPKVRRDRQTCARVYGPWIDALYAESELLDDPTFIPGIERRLRPRLSTWATGYPRVRRLVTRDLIVGDATDPLATEEPTSHRFALLAHETATLAAEAYASRRPEAIAQAERLLYLIHVRTAFGAPAAMTSSMVWTALMRAKLRGALLDPTLPSEISLDELTTRLDAAVREADAVDHALLEDIVKHPDLRGVTVYTKNWFSSTHGFTLQLLAMARHLQGKPQLRPALDATIINITEEFDLKNPHLEIRTRWPKAIGVEYSPQAAVDDPDQTTEAFALQNLRTGICNLPEPCYAMGSLYTIEAVFTGVCRRMYHGLKDRFSDHDLEIFKSHAEADPFHAAEWFTALRECNLSGAQRAMVLRGGLAQLAARHRMFEAVRKLVARSATGPLPARGSAP